MEKKTILFFILIIIAIFLGVLETPVEVTPEKQLEDSALLESYYAGSIAALEETTIIFKNGSYEFYDKHGHYLNSELSNEYLESLTNHINSKNYFVIKKTMKEMLFPDEEYEYSDPVYGYIIINDDGKTVSIATDKIVHEILFDIRESAMHSDN